MKITYRCSQCGETFTSDEYHKLNSQSLKTDDPEDEYGRESVCVCGAGFHTDKWNILDEITRDNHEFEVSTVALLMAHGPNRDQWYETAIFGDEFSTIIRRYETEQQAEDGHDEVLRKLRKGKFELMKTITGIKLD